MVALSENAKIMSLIAIMLCVGSWNTLCAKYQFQTCGPTLDLQRQKDCPSGQKLFNKPWTQNLMMFMGEASIMIVYCITRRRPTDDIRRARLSRPTIESPRDGLLPAEMQKTPFYVFAIPAFCDVGGTGLACVGLMYIDSALYQMLRSSIIIFTAVVSVVFLKRRLQAVHWIATFVVFCGLCCVGLASILDAHSDPDANPTERMMGIGLLIIAQICAAFQYVFEEKLLIGQQQLSAKKLVGMEGMWGIFYMIVILTAMGLLPGDDAGHVESFPDAMDMISGSPRLAILVVTYMMSLAVYNLTGLTLGKKMSAVVRCLVDSCRTIVVWAVNLLLYYGGLKDYGAPWTPHSWMTAIGFLLLVLGTLLYNEVLPLPFCLMRPDAEASKAASLTEEDFGSTDTPPCHMDVNNSQVECPTESSEVSS